MWHTATAMRGQLRELGLVRGQVVVLAASAHVATLPLLLAVWAEAMTICFLPHDVSDKARRMAPDKFREMLELVSPALVIVEDGMQDLAAQASTARITTLDSFVYSAQCCTELPLESLVLTVADDLAVLQFTSGSSGLPKAAMITQGMLAANCEAISQRVMVTDHDSMVSWLPLNHDMGLSAITLALWNGINLVLIPTSQYARQPLIWFDALSQYRGTLSPAPASAYALVSRFGAALGKRRPDLFAWRYGWAGAEPVFDHVLRAFHALMAPYGLRPDVIAPAYGMAETVVATSLHAPGRPYRTLSVLTSALATGGCVQLCKGPSTEISTFVSNGMPVDGVEIRVVDDHRQLLPENRAGHLQVRGSSVIARYLGRSEQAVCADGWYDTGDIGFLHNKEVYVSGRSKDIIIRGGRNISPYHVEQAIEAALSLRPGSVGVFAVFDIQRTTDRIWAVIGSNAPPEQHAALRAHAARAAVAEAGLQLDEICFIAGKALPKTTSGKIQRSALRLMYR